MVASALETRLRRLIDRPLEFWPFQKGIGPDERAMRAARLTLYLGVVYAHERGRAEALLLPAAAAMSIVLLFGGKRGLALDRASLARDPNPAGNALFGDIGGRSADVPQPTPNVSAEEFARRMQEPIRVDDYQIRPVLAPNQGHQVWRDPSVIPSSTQISAGSRTGATFQDWGGRG